MSGASEAVACAPMAVRQLVIVDADTVAGWRRSTPSLAQLWSAVEDLRTAEPDVTVAVIADASLKWALTAEERDAVDEAVGAGRMLFPPAGCEGGHVAFIAEVVRRAEEQGRSPVVITDQAVPQARICRVRREGDRWAFDLSEAKVTKVTRAAPQHRRRRGKADQDS